MIGTKLSNRYEILRELGRGGMGVVYLAYDPLLEREVAVKLVTPHNLSTEAEERFRREARVVAKMDHPAIVTVHNVGEHEGSFYFVMPYVPGTNLRAFLLDNSLSLGEILDIGIQVAEALEYSHARGVIHRDIKPENILVTRRENEGIRVRITDFGLAIVSHENRLTQSGSLVGTVAYLSPEQVVGDPLDGRSDIYSLGTVLYECLAGELPFSGDLESVLYRIARENPQSLHSLGAYVDEELEKIVMQCLQKDPDRRLQRPREVVEGLTQYRSRLRKGDQSRLMLSTTRRVRHEKPVVSFFVGREREFAELQRRLNDSLLGECQFAVIGGEAGIGKSRLLDELETLAKARKIRTLHGRFIEQDRALPYQGFCDIIQEYFHSKLVSSSSSAADFSDLSPDLASLFPVLAEMGEIRSTGSSRVIAESRKAEDKTYIYELLARSITRIASGKPLMILLEDLHTAEVSLEALQYIVHRLGPTPTLIVGTYRSTEVDKRHPLMRMLNSFQGDRRFVSIALKPFTTAEHRAFMEELVGSSKLGNDFAEKLYEATEGNPYFTKELIRSLFDLGNIIQDEAGTWVLSSESGISMEALPATIQQTVEKRIERLPQDLREILSITSIVGKAFEFRDLKVLTEGMENVEDALDLLLRAGFIEVERESRGDRFHFSSGVVRDVLYSQLSRRKRKSLHRKYAEYLERRHIGRAARVYPQLVHHYSQADVPEKVVEYGLKLAKKSLDTFSGEEAIRAVRTALDFLEDVEQVDPAMEGEARILLSAAYRITGNIDGALKEIESAIKIFQQERQTSRLVDAMVLAAQTAWGARRVEETIRWVGKGLDVARPAGETQNLVKLLSLAATVSNLRAEYEKTREYLEEVERLVPATRAAESEESPRGGRLVVALPFEIRPMHPIDIKLDEEAEILANVFETLLKTDTQGNLIPWLCERWESLDGGKSYLLTIRPDVYMQDRRPVTAADIKVSFETAIYRGRDHMPSAFAAVRGVPEYVEGVANNVDGIRVISENKMEIQLTERLPIYPALLTEVRTAVVRQSTQSQWVGTGPFKIAVFKPSDVILETDYNYWKGSPPFVDAVEFRGGLSAVEIGTGFREGRFDLVRDLLPQDLEEILRDRRLRANLVEATKKNIYFVLFNTSSAVGHIPLFRQALCGIVRTQDLVRRTLGRFAQPAEGLYPPGILGHDPGKRRYPLVRDKAVEMLMSALGASNRSLPIQLKASVHPILQDRYLSLTKALFQVWSDLGVEISVETHNMEAFLRRLSDNEGIDLMIGRWIAEYDDPDDFTYTLFHSQMGDRRSYYSSKELDQLIEEARVEDRPGVRERLYRKIEALLIDSGILLPLFHEVDYRVAHPSVKQLTLRSNAPYVNYSEVRKAEAAAPAIVRKVGGGVVHIPLAGEIRSLDPSLVRTAVESQITPAIFENLYRQTEGTLALWLASEVKVEEGSRRFRIRLRDGVRFHDGRRLTARDVRYSFERLLQAPECESRWFFSPIRGAKAMLNGERGDLEGFRILSSSEFVIDLDEPVSFFPALLAYYSAAIVQEGTDQLSGSWRERCVGTGPFRVVRFEPGRRLELEANPHYWRPGYPKSDGLVFSFGVPPGEILSGFRDGRFSLAWDLFPSDVDDLRHESELGSQYRETPRLSTYVLVFNVHKGPLSDEDLRRRLVGAIDVEPLVQRNVGRLAIPAHGLIPPGLLGYEAIPLISPNPNRKRQPAQPIELTAAINAVYKGPYSPLAKDLFQTLDQAGFHVRVLNEAPSEFREYYRLSEAAGADIVLTRWIGDYPDADTYVHGFLHSEQGHMGRFCGAPELDRLIEKGRTESQPEIRHSIYREVEEIIASQALLLPLFYEQVYCFARPEVEEFEINFFSPVVSYEKLWIRR